jgi:hypothetical protein
MAGIEKYKQKWMSWHQGVDAVLFTQEGLPMPNILIHTARMVHTPFGAAAAGMLIFNPDLAEQPKYFGFLCEEEQIGRYFGPYIFAGTPFEKAPMIKAKLEITAKFPTAARTKVTIGKDVIELNLSEFDDAQYYNRPVSDMTPFVQNVIEARAKKAEVKYNGKLIKTIMPPAGIGGGLPACFSPTGLYFRE